MLKEGKIKRYLLYAIGEVLLVMIGILLALQVNDWNDQRLRRLEEKNYYQNVREQIIADSLNIFGNRQYNRRYLNQFNTAIAIVEENDRTQIDSLGKIILNLTEYSDFDRQGNIYETLVTGGEIKLIRNQDIINAIQLLEGRYIYMNRMENIHWDVIMQDVLPSISESLKFSTAEIQKPEQVYSYRFQNLILGLTIIMEEKETIYIENNERIKALIDLIDQELAENRKK
jgi:hypothetical protein